MGRVELSFNENDEIFIIEINARQGGMRLPEFVHIYSKVDMNKLLVSTATADYQYLNSLKSEQPEVDLNVIHYRLLTDQTGTYQGICLSERLKQYLVKEFYYYNVGQKVVPTFHSMASIGVLDFSFRDAEIRKYYEEMISEEIEIIIK